MSIYVMSSSLKKSFQKISSLRFQREGDIILAHSKYTIIFLKGKAAMEYSMTGPPSSYDQSSTLKMAEHFTPVVTVIDQSSGIHYSFRKFLWSGNWGICDANCTKIIVRAKANYLYVDILAYAECLVAGSPHSGWDVYSLTGTYIGHIQSMSLAEVIRHLSEKKRNS